MEAFGAEGLKKKGVVQHDVRLSGSILVYVGLLGIFFWRKGRGSRRLAEPMGEKGGCMKSLNKMHASIRTRAILALRPSGERTGKDPAHHAETLVRAELE